MTVLIEAMSLMVIHVAMMMLNSYLREFLQLLKENNLTRMQKKYYKKDWLQQSLSY
jgi:hypothetical protein